MIDIESKVFDTVYNAIIAQYPNASIVGEYVDIPASFPCITLIEEDNYTYGDSQDDSLNEHNANIMYEANVYCKGSSKKITAKSIANLLDNTMQNMKFTRTHMGQTPNEERTIYRITLRYTAVVGEGITEGTTTTYQMYRR